MNSENPVTPVPTIDDAREARLNTALRMAAIMAQASARLFKLQSEAANAAFEENSRHLTTLLSTLDAPDSAALLAEWSRLYQANVGRLLDVTRRCFDIVPRTPNELAKLISDPFASANKQTQLYLEQFTKAIDVSRRAAAGADGLQGAVPVGGAT